MTHERFFFSLFLLSISFTGIAPLVVIVGGLGVYRYPQYVEILFIGWFFELLYGTGVWGFFPHPLFLTVFLLYLLLNVIHARLR